jgi:hypothetical protein
MTKRGVVILAVVVLAASAGLVLGDSGDDATRLLTRPPRGSLAAQLRLKLQLEMVGGSSLAASLDHNEQEWLLYTPDQREQYRRWAVAFLRKNPREQEKLLKHFSAFLSLTKTKRDAYVERARWVKAVAASFTPEQREQLRKMTSMDRARALLERRDELVRQGKLKLRQRPSTAPASPASRPTR